jgi:hypothetical protein
MDIRTNMDVAYTVKVSTTQRENKLKMYAEPNSSVPLIRSCPLTFTNDPSIEDSILSCEVHF